MARYFLNPFSTIPYIYKQILIILDRDRRTPNKCQILFDARPHSLEGEALEQLEAEIDRVLNRRNDEATNSSTRNNVLNPEELRDSNYEINRVLGLINKSKFKPKRSNSSTEIARRIQHEQT